MTVGEYAGVPLQDAGDTWRNGAVFLLRKAALQSVSVSLDGWVTAVVAGHKMVVTCGQSTATGFDAAYEDALTAANQGLDYMSVTGAADCAIRDAHDECLVWWPDRAHHGTVMRARVITTHPVIVSATGTVTDAAGNVVPFLPPPTPMVHDAFRFIRMCRTSDDLYDSYRNLFLAFECLLSDIRPPQQITTRRGWGWLRWGPATTKWEGERQWFRAALTEANNLVPLVRLTPPGDQTNHVKWVMKHVYDRERSALMHAKQNRGRDYLLPQDHARRADLTASLGRLWGYLRELIKEHLDVTSPSGGLFAPGWAMFADPVLSAMEAFVSDDASELHPQPDRLLPEGATVVEVPTAAPASDPADVMLRTILGGRDTADLQTLDAIRKIGAKTKGAGGPALVVSELTGPLQLGDSVTRFEVLHGMRNASPSAAPRIFSA